MVNWQIEKNIPISILIGGLVHLAVLVWAVSKYDSRMTEHESRITRLEATDREFSTVLQQISDRLSRIEGKLEVGFSAPRPLVSRDGK